MLRVLCPYRLNCKLKEFQLQIFSEFRPHTPRVKIPETLENISSFSRKKISLKRIRVHDRFEYSVSIWIFSKEK